MQNKGKRIAIIIGTSEFDDEGFNNLQGPTQDAIRLTNILQNQSIGNYEVKMFVNSSSHNVNKAIEQFFAVQHKDDTVLFYYSGHGLMDESRRLYFATTDTNRKLPRSTAISASFVSEVMNTSRSRNQIVLLDCCYSGAFAYGVTDSRGRVVISSSSAVQVSIEKQEEGDSVVSGVFTNTLLKGLETGEADLNSDGQITFFELFNYIIWKLEEKQSIQTPKMWAFDLSADIVVAESCRKSFKVKTQN